MLIDNKVCSYKTAICGGQLDGKKEWSRQLNKTTQINVAPILSNNPGEVPEQYTVNYPKNAGVVATESEASKNRKALQLPCLYQYNKTVADDIYKDF